MTCAGQDARKRRSFKIMVCDWMKTSRDLSSSYYMTLQKLPKGCHGLPVNDMPVTTIESRAIVVVTSS